MIRAVDAKPIHPPHPSGHRYAPIPRPDYCGRIALVLQGGGALGAYQGGVYEALHEAGLEPDWVIGTSIGAINGALVAANTPAQRLPRLRALWERIAQPGTADVLPWPPGLGRAVDNLGTL